MDIYVDYGCPPCGNFEQATGYDLTNYVTQNKITLSIHPVAFIDNRSKNQYSSRAAASVAWTRSSSMVMSSCCSAGPTNAEMAFRISSRR